MRTARICRKMNGKPRKKQCPVDHVMRDRCCIPCTECPPGYKTPTMCTGECTKCPQFPHRTFSSDGVKCVRCKDCEALGLTTITNCTDVSNSDCGLECRDRGHYYDPSVQACRPSAIALRVATTDSTTSLPDVSTGCKMHQLSSKSSDCITLRPPAAGLYPMIGFSGVALVVCVLVIVLVLVAGFIWWYIGCKQRRIQSSRKTSDSTVQEQTRFEHVHTVENDYAEISESAVPSLSSNSVRTEMDQRNYGEDVEEALNC